VAADPAGDAEVVVAAVVAAEAAVVAEDAAAEVAPMDSGAGRLTGSTRPSATGGARNRRTPVRYS